MRFSPSLPLWSIRPRPLEWCRRRRVVNPRGAVPNLPVLQGFAVGMQGLDIDLTTGAMHTTDRPSAIIR